MKRALLAIIIMLAGCLCYAQQYMGMSGMIHVPSAEMDTVGDTRLGTHFLNRHFTPDHKYWYYEGSKYNTMDFYVSLTPFKWVELGYTMTLFKHTADGAGDKSGYNSKDRYISVKFRPLEEGKYWPAVAIGANDFLTSNPLKRASSEDTNDFWRNYYVALTKHFDLNGHELAPTLACRYFTSDYNHGLNGLVGGVTYRPLFAKNVRAIVEWTGRDVNIGVDCLLWNHLLAQASLQRGKWPSAGLCYVVNLF